MSYVHGRSIIRIAIADDDETLQDLLPGYFSSIENCKVVIQAYNGRDLLEKLKQKPDTTLVLMDIRMPEMDGIEAAKKVKADFPELKILFSSIYHNELVYCRVIGAGGDGFIRKGATVSEYKKAIFEVMKTGWFFPNTIQKTLKPNGHTIKHSNRLLITDEEVEFLRLVGTGLTYDAIASKLNTSLRHIDYIRQGLFEKYEVKSRVELALYAYQGGLYA